MSAYTLAAFRKYNLVSFAVQESQTAALEVGTVMTAATAQPSLGLYLEAFFEFDGGCCGLLHESVTTK